MTNHNVSYETVFYYCNLHFFSLALSAQENTVQDKITLKTSEIYVGKIVLKTNDMIMLSTMDGTRYQFQLSEIKKMET
ncbi:MAG: hypothetical protein ACYC25_03530 [Paludibacter sp.]